VSCGWISISERVHNGFLVFLCGKYILVFYVNLQNKFFFRFFQEWQMVFNTVKPVGWYNHLTPSFNHNIYQGYRTKSSLCKGQPDPENMSEIAYPAPAANTKIRKKLKVLLPMFMQHVKINSNGDPRQTQNCCSFCDFLNGISELGLKSTNRVTFLINV
jgi:hypothetical protein